MTRLTANWLSRPGPQAVSAMLTDAGFTALFVGGCVRNTLLKTEVSDIDIATDAHPERVMALAGAAGLHAVPTGIDHGTVTVVYDHEPYEITTFRKDVSTDGRRAVVAFATSVQDDAHRRDFTMNAIYADAAGAILDPVGGLPDLEARIIRFIGDPAARVQEDYLRILRFFRFNAWYGDPKVGPDAEGLATCAAFSAGIDTLSKERIGHEMLKMLAAPDPAPAVASMAAAGVLTRSLPGADHRFLAPLVHCESEAGIAPDALRRLAVLGGEDAKDALRLSRADARHLAGTTRALGADLTPAALSFEFGAKVATDALLIRHATLSQPMPTGWQDQVDRGSTAKFPVQARDLPDTLEGPAIGAHLKDLKTRWLASDLSLSKDDLLG